MSFKKFAATAGLAAGAALAFSPVAAANTGSLDLGSLGASFGSTAEGD